MNEKAIVKIIEEPRFDIQEFIDRWRAARMAAIRKVTGTPAPAVLFFNQNDDSEVELLLTVTESQKEAVYRHVFDNSRKLALGLVKFLGLVWDRSDIADVASRLNGPCFSSEWKDSERGAHVFRRGPCTRLQSFSSEQAKIYCGYWREALDGLVMGLGDDSRYARHGSGGHGDSECVDVIFSEIQQYQKFNEAQPTAGARLGQLGRFGTIPEKIKSELGEIQTDFNRQKVEVILDGLSEGILYYHLNSGNGPLCGVGGQLMHQSFLRAVQKRFPDLRVQDSSPLAVYGGAK